MASKPQKAARKGVVYKNRQPQGHKVEAIARRRVTCRAQSNVEKCNMVLRVYLSLNDEWFLHKNSCLDHCNHRPIAAEAMTKRATEMNSQDVTMVSNALIIIAYIYVICTY